MFDADKTKWLSYGTVKNLWQYVKPFSCNTGTSRTDKQTDGQTDRFAISISHNKNLVRNSAVFDYRYRYRDISPYRIISISTPVISKLSIWRRTIQPAIRLDERVSRWFNLTGGQRRVNTWRDSGEPWPTITHCGGCVGGGILLLSELRLWNWNL